MMPKRFFGVLPLIAILVFLSSLVSPSQAQQAEYNPGGFCNLTPNGASTGNVTLANSCVIYEDINGVANGDLIISPGTSVTLHHNLVFYPSNKITVSPGAKIFVNSDSFIKQGKLCLKVGPSGTYPAVKTITGNLEPSTGTLITGSALTQIDAQLATFTPPNTFSCNAGYALRETFASLAYVDTGAGDIFFSTSDADMLGLGFTINGVTSTLAAAGDIQVDPAKNLILLGGGIGGKLSIGNATPSAFTIEAWAPLARMNLKSTTSTNIASYRATSGTNDGVFGTESSTGGTIFSGSSPYATVLGSYYFYPLQLGTFGATRMTIDTSGNVGIGTTSPSSKLTVAFGAGTTEANIKANTANNLLNLTSNYTAGADYAPGISFSSTDNSSGVSKAGIYSRFTSSGSYLYLGTSNNYASGVTNNAVTIDYSGNVGIGTTAPSQILEANGNLKLTPSNPYLYTGGSYLVIPNGMYISGASIPLYTEARIQARGGISNDTGTSLNISGGTSGNTQFTGTVGITAANTVAYPVIISSTISSAESAAVQINANNSGLASVYGYALEVNNSDNNTFNGAIKAVYAGTGSSTYAIQAYNNSSSTAATGIYASSSNGNAGYFSTSAGYAVYASGRIRVDNNEIQATYANQIRYVQGNYGLINRQDGTNFYMLTTNSGDAYGTWNANRPFAINMSTGNVGIGNPPDNTARLTVTGCTSASTTGPFAGAGGNAAWTTGFATQNICRTIAAANAVVAGNFYSVSDAREKNNIQPIDPKLVDTFLSNAKPSLFNWKFDGNVDSGFIAQDLIQSGLGYLVSSAPDPKMKQDVRNGFTSPAGTKYSVNYNSIIPILTQIAKDQQAKIDNQQKQIDSLNQRLQELENKLSK